HSLFCHFSLFMPRRPPTPTRFPYTTLFRSSHVHTEPPGFGHRRRGAAGDRPPVHPGPHGIDLSGFESLRHGCQLIAPLFDFLRKNQVHGATTRTYPPSMDIRRVTRFEAVEAAGHLFDAPPVREAAERFLRSEERRVG